MNERRKYDDGYKDGWGIGYQDAMVDNQVIAFGAIRRAAEVARQLDAQYEEAYLVRDWDTCSLIHDGFGIRRAIRAAIGSEKA